MLKLSSCLVADGEERVDGWQRKSACDPIDGIVSMSVASCIIDWYFPRDAAL